MTGDSHGKKIVEVTIQDAVIRLIFACDGNDEIPTPVREILKSAYIQRQAGYSEKCHACRYIAKRRNPFGYLSGIADHFKKAV